MMKQMAREKTAMRATTAVIFFIAFLPSSLTGCIAPPGPIRLPPGAAAAAGRPALLHITPRKSLSIVFRLDILAPYSKIISMSDNDSRRDGEATGVLKIATIVTVVFFLVETAGGFISGSLSLLGDAWHMFRDILALLISLSAVNISRKLPTKDKTFGFHRLEILAALLNGILLVGVGVWVIIEARQRLRSPRPIENVVMLIVASLGLAANIYVAFRLHGSRDLNIRSAFIHVFTDAVSSLAVILAAVLIMLTGKTIFDPILSIFISLLVIVSALGVIRESATILLEFAPRNVDFDRVISDMQGVEGVESVHYVHLWTLCSNINVVDAHIFTKEMDMSKMEVMKAAIKSRLEKYDVRHATLEFECVECVLPDKVKSIGHP
jgi:cobalt-zinc-cadmium efflux system protein